MNNQNSRYIRYYSRRYNHRHSHHHMRWNSSHHNRQCSYQNSHYSCRYSYPHNYQYKYQSTLCTNESNQMNSSSYTSRRSPRSLEIRQSKLLSRYTHIRRLGLRLSA